MAFVRQQTDSWQRKVPGVRWFKADLHTHTIDDAPSDSDTTAIGNNEELAAYARQFLAGAVSNAVQVLGLTPHKPKIEADSNLSAVWQIVDEWNSGTDSDNVAYRDKIFAVFPGFTVSLHDGRGALRLMFLFDPEIGRDRYLQLFDAILHGKAAQTRQQPATTDLTPAEVFDLLRAARNEDAQLSNHHTPSWDFLALAPDVFAETGLFGTAAEQVNRDNFDTRLLGGLELSRNQLPAEAMQSKPWIKEFIARNRLTFFHSSSAYHPEQVGERHVWVKMADPKIEALRQAFVASESRVRCGHELSKDGEFQTLEHPPDVTLSKYPWLKSLTVKGKASFFGRVSDDKSPNRFEFSPDLNCIIGGSMTGKSTLLDGLRVYINAPLPLDERTHSGVIQRANQRLLAGSPTVELDCPGSDPTASSHERWPAIFYAQGELQRLTQEPGAIDDVLAGLDASESPGINDRKRRLDELDKELQQLQQELARLHDGVAEAEQALTRSENAKSQLVAFANAGVDELNRASGSAASWVSHVKTVSGAADRASELAEVVEAFDISPHDDSTSTHIAQLKTNMELARTAAHNLKTALTEATKTVSTVSAEQQQQRDALRKRVDKALAEQGLDGSRINELQALNAQSALIDSYKANHKNAQHKFEQMQAAFERTLTDRRDLVQEQRDAYDRVLQTISKQFDSRVIARRINHACSQNLAKFLTGLGQRGITRWWNDTEPESRPSPDQLLEALNTRSLASVGMSKTVQETFLTKMTIPKQRELAAVRCPDRYVVEFGPDGSKHRPLSELSGGKRVNLMLSLLLETADNRPLVIDQPEDELDNRFLFETLLPALGRLKGRRQVILATHNANIVVNGDADQIIQLDASAQHGYVAVSGAIENPDVRDAIVQTVDGGDEAFHMRKIKYGF